MKRVSQWDSRETGWLLSWRVAPGRTSDRLRIAVGTRVAASPFETSLLRSPSPSSFRPLHCKRLPPLLSAALAFQTLYTVRRLVTRDRGRSRSTTRGDPATRDVVARTRRMFAVCPMHGAKGRARVRRGTVEERRGCPAGVRGKTKRRRDRGSDVTHAVASRRLNSRSASSIDFDGGGKDYGP